MIRLFRVFIPASVVALLVSEIVLVLGCYLFSLFVLGIDPGFYLFGENNYWKLLVVTGLIILLLYFQDLYAKLRITSRVVLVQQVCLAVGCALLLMALCRIFAARVSARPLAHGAWQFRRRDCAAALADWFSGSTSLPDCVPSGCCCSAIRAFSSEIIAADARPSGIRLFDPRLSLRGGGQMRFPDSVSWKRGVKCGEFAPSTNRRASWSAWQSGATAFPFRICSKSGSAAFSIEDAADTYEMAMHRVCSRKIQPSQLIFSSMLGPRSQAIAFQKAYSLVIGWSALIVTSAA